MPSAVKQILQVNSLCLVNGVPPVITSVTIIHLMTRVKIARLACQLHYQALSGSAFFNHGKYCCLNMTLIGFFRFFSFTTKNVVITAQRSNFRWIFSSVFLVYLWNFKNTRTFTSAGHLATIATFFDHGGISTSLQRSPLHDGSGH